MVNINFCLWYFFFNIFDLMMKIFGGEIWVRNKCCKIFNYLYIRCIEGEVGLEKFYEILFCSDVCVLR